MPWRTVAAGGFLVSVAAIVWLSLSTHGPTANRAPPPPVPVWDKVLHLAAYAWLTALGVVALGHDRVAWFRWIGVGLMTFGVWIEMIQARLPFHTGSVVDAVANGAGILLVLWVTGRLARKRR
ncbi:hypothetical protein C882_1565 [Caenispirillum salinarum AK4]|uniref:VanZ-like domain-containing protein n=1 Tax=Caenispirillum salinarum AK4 TaxID=1238182 RepID=K9HR34_9PROT|nr:hypothetical protein C882_1565 [Caenispirillum salinarum AK4]